MERESVDGVVDLEQDLDPGGVVGDDGGDEPDRERSRRADVSSRRGDADETGEDTRAERSSRPLPRVDAAGGGSVRTAVSARKKKEREHLGGERGNAQVQSGPGQSAHGGCNLSDDGGLDGPEVHSAFRTSVESEPEGKTPWSAEEYTRDGRRSGLPSEPEEHLREEGQAVLDIVGAKEDGRSPTHSSENDVRDRVRAES